MSAPGPTIAGRDLHLPKDLNQALGTIKKPLRIHHPPDTLTIAMIVKDEAANLEAAIRSFQPFADEIVVNDTGSTDGTQAILERLGVKWFQTEWPGDFSLARNLSVERATSTWVLWLDADDRVPADQVENFRKLKTAPTDRVFGFQVINTQAGKPYGARFMQLRMFPNDPRIRFERKVHEQFVFGAARLGLHAFFTETIIWHTGYEDEGKKKVKARRNLELAQQDGSLIGKDPTFTMSLGDSWYILEEWQKGIEAYQTAFAIPHLREINRDVHADLPFSIGIGHQRLGAFAEAIRWYDQAHELQPAKLEPLYHKGEALTALGRRPEAMDIYRRILEMPLVHSSTANQFDAIRIFAFHNLAQLLMEEARFAEALETLEDMAKAYPDIAECWHAMGECRWRLGEAAGAAEAWEKAVRMRPGLPAAVYRRALGACEQAGDRERKGRLAELAEKQYPAENWRDDAGGPELKPGISLCMIVKNEEAFLGKCLESVRGLFDELIVVDTGSTDRTAEIAAGYGARVLPAEWKNDFSAARNVSLAAASCRWLMWLDADDVMLEGDRRALTALLERDFGPRWRETRGDRAYGLLVQSSQDGGATGAMFSQIRLFPNRPEVRFESPVHEQVMPALERLGIPVTFTEVKVIHTGYVNEEIAKKKQRRNREILEKQVAEGGNVTPVTLYTLACACLDLGEREAALEWFLQAVELAEKTHTDPHIIGIGPARVAGLLLELGRREEARHVIGISLQGAEVHPEAILVKANLEKDRPEEARPWFERLIGFEERRTLIPADYNLLKIRALEFLGGYWNARGKMPLAVELLKRGLAIKQGVKFGKADLEEMYARYGV